mmetsp:Transcript_31226/g.67206  ORF Transcript_31226/g.67206 Transcript_31226/m.67206 type:complete len:1174 (+) Transcript_31226:3-3524(+)
MEHLVSQVLDLSLRVYRACAPEGQAAESLLGLIRGLGYVVNKRGDLAGMSWQEWRNFDPNQVFEQNTLYLKAVLAMAFGDELFIGGYGALPKALEFPAETHDQSTATPAKIPDPLKVEKALMLEMSKRELDIRHTIAFSENCGLENEQEIEDYVVFVCQERPERPLLKVKAEEVGFTLVSLDEADHSRWLPLASRQSAPLLECPRRLPAEFQLFSSTERCLKDLQKARSMASGWRFGAVSARHPTMLHWEWMKHGSPARSLLTRVEGNFGLRNPTGCIGHLPNRGKQAQPLTQIAALVVASSLAGGESGGRLYPSGVTKLCPGHIPFMLAVANLDISPYGFHKFGFTTTGSFMVLHRCLKLSKEVVNQARWGNILRLREAIRAELQVPEDKWEDSWTATPPTFTKNSQVAAFGRALFEAVKCEEGGDEAVVDPVYDCNPREAVKWTIGLGADEQQPELQAFQPLAPWSLLAKRREAMRKEGGRTWTWAMKKPRARSPPKQAFDAAKKARKEEPEVRVIGDNREAHSSKDVTSMTLDELTRMAHRFHRCVTSSSEKRRLLKALSAAQRDSKLTIAQREAVRQRRDQAEDALRTISRDPASGRELFLHVLKELEKRLPDLDRAPRDHTPMSRSRSHRGRQASSRHHDRRSRSSPRRGRRRSPSVRRRRRSHSRERSAKRDHGRKSRSRHWSRRSRDGRSRDRSRDRSRGLRKDRDRSDRVREKSHANVRSNFSSTPAPAATSEAPRRRFTEQASSTTQAKEAAATERLPRVTASRSRDASRPAKSASPPPQKKQNKKDSKIPASDSETKPPPPIALPDGALHADSPKESKEPIPTIEILEEEGSKDVKHSDAVDQKEVVIDQDEQQSSGAAIKDADMGQISGDSAVVATIGQARAADQPPSSPKHDDQAEQLSGVSQRESSSNERFADLSPQVVVDAEVEVKETRVDGCDGAVTAEQEAARTEHQAPEDKRPDHNDDQGMFADSKSPEEAERQDADKGQSGKPAAENQDDADAEAAARGDSQIEGLGVQMDESEMDGQEEAEVIEGRSHDPCGTEDVDVLGDENEGGGQEEVEAQEVEVEGGAEVGPEGEQLDGEVEGQGEPQVEDEFEAEGEGGEEEAAEEDEVEDEDDVEWVEGYHPWVKVWDADNQAHYYHNEETGESMWEHPQTLSAGKES